CLFPSLTRLPRPPHRHSLPTRCSSDLLAVDSSTGTLILSATANASTPGASEYVRLTRPYHGTAAATSGYSDVKRRVSAPPPQKPVTPMRSARAQRCCRA